MRPNLAEAAKAKLAASGIEASAKRLDAFTGKEGDVLRQLPTVTASTYYDGSRDVTALLQVVSRRRSQAEAMAACYDAMEALDGAWLPDLKGMEQTDGISTEVLPQEFRLEEAGFYAWACTLGLPATMGSEDF